MSKENLNREYLLAEYKSRINCVIDIPVHILDLLLETNYTNHRGSKMPVYEYVCPDCGLKFELLRPLSQANQGASCPRCHNGAERIFSVFASFSESESGETTPLAGTASSCGSCSATSCDSCNL